MSSNTDTTADQPRSTPRKRSKRRPDDKTARIDIRVTPKEKQEITQRANELGLTLSEFVMLSCAKDPASLTDILRKARPAERMDPEIVTAVARANLQLAEIRDTMSKQDRGTSPTLMRAILATLLSVHRQLQRALK